MPYIKRNKLEKIIKMRFSKILFRLTILIMLLTGCSDISDGFKGKQVGKGEEFLIDKKNPLVVPPDFDKLPEPRSNNSTDPITTDENLENYIKKLFEENEGVKIENKIDNSLGSTEESILKKIK